MAIGAGAIDAGGIRETYERNEHDELAAGRRPPRAAPELSGVTATRRMLAPWTSTRFSHRHRQRRRMPMSGVHGEAVVTGEALRSLAPLLSALTVSSVGKATSLGMGGLCVGPARDSQTTTLSVGVTRAARSAERLVAIP